MNRKSLLLKLEKASRSDCRYMELVIFGNIDDSGEEKWSSMSLGMQSENACISEQDIHDKKELLTKWRDYIISAFDYSGHGVFVKGKLELVDFIWGNDISDVASRVAKSASKHWRAKTLHAIVSGVASSKKL